MTKIQVRRGTTSQWGTAATVLAAGEPGQDTTTGIIKIGDGSTAWASLLPTGGPTQAIRVTDATSTTLSGTLVAGHLTPIDATAGAGARTLPAASSVAAGGVTAVKKADTSTNAVTVSRAGSDVIFGTGSGGTTRTVTLPGEAVVFTSNGVNAWTVMASDTPVAQLDLRYPQLLVTDATSTAASGTLAAWHLTPVDATSAPSTWTLPAANSVTAGVETAVKKSDVSANTVTVSRAGSDLIYGTGSGSTTKTLSLAGEAVTLVSNGVDRWTVQTSDTPSGVLTTTFAPIAATPVASSATSGTLTAAAEHNLSPTSAAAWTLPTGIVATKLPTTVKNNGTATVTVARGGSDTINGGTASVSIAPGEWARFTSDGAGAWTQSGTAGQSTTYASLATGRVRNSGQAVNRYIDPTTVTQVPSAVSGKLLTVATGYTGNDIVEPSILYDVTAPFLGYEYVLCAAPYYQSNIIYENPCLWVSHDGNTWVPVVSGVPTPGYGGTATPIFANAGQGDGNNSDPYITRGPDGTYYVLWNQGLIATGSGGTGTGSNNWGIKITKATNLAGPWSTAVSVLQTASGTSKPSSPSIFWDGYQWQMYAVELTSVSTTALLRYTNPATDPTTGTWTAQTAPSVSFPANTTGRVWWHLNAYLAGTQHVLLIQDNVSGTSGGGNLWVAVSNDSGATWTLGNRPWLQSSNQGYRSCLVFTPNGADVFYGRLGSNWELRRAPMAFYGNNAGYLYGGVTAAGLPSNALAVGAARIPITPYQIGDIPSRADSASSLGAADSGQTWTSAAGTLGISSKTFYSPSTGNNKSTITTTVADGVSSYEVAAVDAAGSYFVIFRITDANNFVRFGVLSGTITVNNVVAGVVSQTMTISGNTGTVAGDVFTMLHIGSTLTLYQNGIPVGTATGWTANQSATDCGIQINSAGIAKIRNVWQRALVNGT